MISKSASLSAICLLLFLLPCCIVGQEESGNQVATPAATKWRFAFERTPWKEVIKWLAEESGMALQIRDLPTGSLNYSDPDEYTLDEAIARLNLFLLADGYSIVRSGNLLSVINIGDQRSLEQLDILARLATASELENLNKHDVVKCIFSLGEVKAEDAVDELTALKLMTKPAIFAKTNRIMITDTVGKLLSVKVILDGFEPSSLDNGTVMRNFELEHVDAEDILLVARPHLGLATGEMIGIDVSMSADLQGKNIFVTGVDDKVKVIQGLVEALDKPKNDPAALAGESLLKNYVIKGGNTETIYQVLQTLLAGQEIRLSVDKKAGAIVALAPADVQAEIAKTIGQLEADEADFEVIDLKYADPYYVISLLEGMLDLPDSFQTDPEDIDPDAPKIDADPEIMRVYVRGKHHQIERIKKIISQIDKPIPGAESNDKLRVFPLRGDNARKTLMLAAKLWKGDNSVVLFPTTEMSATATERTVAEESEVRDPPPKNESAETEESQVLSVPRKPGVDMISCEITSRGLVVQSEDIEALNRFSEHLRTIAVRTTSPPAKPIVFYLKYAKAENAIHTLAELLDGGETAGIRGDSGSLINGSFFNSTASSYAFVTTRGGMTTLTAGSLTIVVDSRLNRLIVQGTSADVEGVESYLKIIDKDSSITEINTAGESHFIQLEHSNANEVAETVRQAFASRIAVARPGQANLQQQQGGQRQTQQPSQNEDGVKKNKEKDTKPLAPAGSKPVDLEPKMTVAVHAPSNSLIITAPKMLFEQVERLVQTIESNNAEVIEVVVPIAPNNLDLLLQTLANETAELTRSATSLPNSRQRPDQPKPVPASPSLLER